MSGGKGERKGDFEMEETQGEEWEACDILCLKTKGCDRVKCRLHVREAESKPSKANSPD